MIVFIDTLDNNRERIKGIDYSIMALIAQRVKLARKVGKLKTENNIPIRNYQVEKNVYERIKRFADEFDIDENFSIDIFERIISQSVHAQLSDIKLQSRQEDQKHCLVIGGEGQMGNWFVNFLISSGYSVDIQDPNTKISTNSFQELPDNFDNYDIIAICAPLDKMREVISEVIENKPSGLIFEISSIKAEIVDMIEEANREDIRFVSVHPMFGPSVNNLADRNLIVCNSDSLEKETINDFIDLFTDTMVNIIEIDIRSHDKYMQYSLGLSHLINLLNGRVLEQSGISFNKLIQLSGTTFKKQLLTTVELFNESPELYYGIQNINPAKRELFENINHALTEISDATIDFNSFRSIMHAGRDYFKGVDF